ncbi:MAG TPA: HAD-IIIC family phosphatase [Polyangiales bacterium]|nr:HAD-IIIC family phosphatase [Polyangiales bacterium]
MRSSRPFDAATHFNARLRLFERQCARLSRGDRGREDVVFLGDSLVEDFRERLGWVNRGIASDHLAFPARNVFQRLGSDRLHPRPRAIITLIGINDLVAHPDQLGRHLESYRHLLANLKQLHPDAELAVVSVLPLAGPLAHLNPQVVQLNRELAELTANAHVKFWDVHSTLYDAQRARAAAGWLRRDGVHLHRVGYARLARVLARFAAGLAPPPVRPAALDTARRERLARAIFASYGASCWDAHSGPEGAANAVTNHILPELDFLARYVESGAPIFRDSYLGSRARFLAKNEALWNGERDAVRALFERDRQLWLAQLPAAGGLHAAVSAAFDEFASALAGRAPERLRLLFLGDCLLEDVELLAGGQLLCSGYLLDADFIVSKNPAEQTRQLEQRLGKHYDGIVYSPLSWEFDSEFRELLEPTPRRPREVREIVESVWRRVQKRLAQLAEHFDCNLYVHDTAAVVRASDDAKRVLKALASYPQRSYARRELGQRIASEIEKQNQRSFHHVFLIEERAAVRDLRDDLTLGRLLYYAGATHPAELSTVVARQLHDYLVANARYADKKVVVCDLDNTLWDGVIGEKLGVRHCEDRQAALLALKQRGVVLAINSKNDPDNVRWDGGLLCAADFVASEISWNRKAAGLSRIAEALNLKLKDFVFLDDRADERALVQEEFPKVAVADPCREQTWAEFRAWAKLIRDGDRTALYHERSEREKLLAPLESERDTAEMFARLQLKLELRRASQDDLKRVHELINRTNQWNLGGSRCSFQQVQSWHDATDHRIYTARVRDRFGDMGVVYCCVAKLEADALHVPVFVLSCRVFGYGVETAVLERLKQDAARHFGAPRLRGQLVHTDHNKPCRSMYADHGFREQAPGVWQYDGGPALAPQPVWFEQISATG